MFTAQSKRGGISIISVGIFSWVKEKEEAQNKHVGNSVGVWKLCSVALSNGYL